MMVRIAIPYLVGFGIYVGTSEAAHRTFLRSWFRAVGPRDGPPWYFIGQDLLAATWSAGGLLILLAFTLWALPRLGDPAWTAFAINSIPLVTRIAPGVNILRHTTHPWDPAHAATVWTSFEHYRGSERAAMNVGHVVSIVVAAAAIILPMRATWRDLRRKADAGAPATSK
jgi:hypothetical protein